VSDAADLTASKRVNRRKAGRHRVQVCTPVRVRFAVQRLSIFSACAAIAYRFSAAACLPRQPLQLLARSIPHSISFGSCPWNGRRLRIILCSWRFRARVMSHAGADVAARLSAEFRTVRSSYSCRNEKYHGYAPLDPSPQVQEFDYLDDRADPIFWG
jgi:hypothetical protein